jgi:hypothetical protein
MRRKPLFFAASAIELLRFIALSFVATALGAAVAGQGDPAVFRYAAAPGLLFAVAFFFLGRDPLHYAPFRLLIVAGKLLSLAAFLPLGLSLLPALLPQAAGRDLRGALPWAAILLGADLLSLLIAAAYGRREKAPEEPRSGVVEYRSAAMPSSPSPPGGAPSSSPASAAPGDKPPSLGPRGPEDIEGVEA